MSTRKVLFHCNANQTLGMGHLVRSLSIAEEARALGWDITFLGDFSQRAIEHAELLAPEQRLTSLDGLSLSEGIRRIKSQNGTCFDVIHIDSYDTELDSFRSDSLVSNMQDGYFGRRAADLHIDGNLGSQDRYRPFLGDETVLLGADGMQVRRAVRKLRHEVRTNLDAPYKILVMLGGTDPHDVTPRVATILSAYEEIQMTIICRPEIQERLSVELGKNANKVRLISFTGDLPSLANSMDLVVTAAGTSVWDFATVGIPMGVIAVADNQLLGYRSCQTYGVGVALGEPPHEDLHNRLAELMKVIRNEPRMKLMSETGRSLVDGLGAWRVATAWGELLQRSWTSELIEAAPAHGHLTVREATLGDAKRLFSWRNDEATRGASLNSGEILWDEHLQWLDAALTSPRRRLLIVESAGEPVGTVRWDYLSRNAWEASITLAPAFRGKGYASPVLQAGETVFGEETVKLIATIHETNRASQRLFSHAGYLQYAPAGPDGFTVRAKWRFGTTKASPK